MQLEAAQLGEQGQVDVELLQNADAVLQDWVVQAHGGIQPGHLCQPALYLLLGHRQAELQGEGLSVSWRPSPTSPPLQALHSQAGVPRKGVSTLEKAMHFQSLMFSEMTRYRCQMLC